MQDFGRIAQEINRRLNSGQSVESIFDYLFENFIPLIPYDRIGIALVDRSGKQIQARWAKSKFPIQHLKIGYLADLAGGSLQDILKTGQPRVINDLIQYFKEHPQSESTQLMIRDGYRSSLTCPLRTNGKNVGVVFFSSVKPFTYQKYHAETFVALADELSVIVEQERLRNFFDASESKDRTLGMVIHDLRSSLSIIHAYHDLIEIKPWFEKLSEKDKEVFSLLQKNTGSMFSLMNELAEMNKLDRQGILLKKQNVPLTAFFEYVASRGRILANKKEIEFLTQIETARVDTAWIDPDQILQVVDNLLTNAVKFSERHSSIILRIKCENDRIVFSVQDHGKGIPFDEISKLFQEFGKTSVRPTEGEQSTGLGLSIAKRIVEQHGGKISVESKYQHGSTFMFWIPLV